MTEALRAPVEVPRPSDEVSLGVGNVATNGHLRLVRSETLAPSFEPLEIDVIAGISEGQTLTQTARQLEDYSPAEIKDARYSAMKKLNTNSTAVLVDRSIRLGLIPIEVEPDEEILARVTGLDRKMLKLYALGVSNHRIAKKGGVGLKTVETYHDGLLERVGAWSRAHAIRRTYEFGIFIV